MTSSAPDANLSRLHESLRPEELLRRHYFRLRQQQQRIERLPTGPRRETDLQRWHSAVQQAREQFVARNEAPFTVQYDTDLPITAYREKIIDLLVHRQVLVLCGETGSGKSTQLPKFCLEAGLGKTGFIGHTQPRRIAARSIAHRLAEELETKAGAIVGYKVRFNDQTQPTSRIKLMTDGVLLAEIQRDRFLDAYDCIILDEAHERSLNIDLLMAYLQRLLPRRPDLRVVITSATIDAEQYANHFQDAIGSAPIVLVEGRGYPVDIRYRGAESFRESQTVATGNIDYDFDSMTQRFCDAIDELLSEGRGDILAFFATERDIRDASKHLRGHFTQRGLHQSIEVLPLYARLTEAEQQRVFQPHRGQRIILATNVAESSLTVPGIRYVIDTGTARISRFAAKSKVQRLPIEPISQASANQRSGRCGRLGPGIAIRLYDESDYLARSPFATPEIRRSDLASTILHIKSLGIDDIESLPWLDPPRPESVREGMNVLRELRAVDDEGLLTQIGRKIARWPVDPRVGRILIEAEQNGCLNDALIVAAAIETQDPRMRPPEKAAAADEAHFKFRDPNSDFLSFLRIWDFYHKLREQLGRSRLERACRDAFLSLVRMREWADVHRQLLEQCKEMNLSLGKRKLILADLPEKGVEVEPRSKQRFLPQDRQQEPQVVTKPGLPEGYEALHRSLLCGLLSSVAMMEEPGKYKGAQNLEVMMWPGSGLKQSRPKWIVAGEFIETTQRYARVVAKIEVEWIEQLAFHLIKYNFDEPHFSKKQGSALVMRRGTLFGLPVSPRIAVPLAPIDPPLARKILIEQGLAEDQFVSRAKFWIHNQTFLETVKKLGDKTRRRDLVIDPYVLIDFYRSRIPDTVIDRVSLEKWDRTLSPPRTQATVPPAVPPTTKLDAKKPLTLSPYLAWEDIVVDIDRDAIEKRFPSRIELGVTQLPVKYLYEPGDQADGVSVVVPQAIVHQLHNERLEWLVPGLLEEKLTCLIKSLPKQLRRHMVPVPDAVKKLLPKLVERQTQQLPFWKSLCEVLSVFAGEPIKQSDFDIESLPQHLRMRVELVDEKGVTVQSSRDLNDLQQSQRSSISTASTTATHSSKTVIYEWARTNMDTWDIESLPKSVVELRGGVRIHMYPTLFSKSGTVRTVDQIQTNLVDHELLAEQMLRQGLVTLLSKIERREIRSQIQYLPQWTAASLWLSDRFAGERLRDCVGELMSRLAFVDTHWSSDSVSTVYRTQVEFEISRLKRVERIACAAAEIGRWLPKFAEANHKIRSLLEKTPATWSENVKSIRAQLTALYSEPLAYHVPWCYVREMPRYLQAIAARLERLKSTGPLKDMQIDSGVSKYWDDYSRRLAAAQPPLATMQSLPVGLVPRLEPTGNLLEYRWLIEELRVSLYAQQLGTRVSVSPKRLDKLKEQFV